MFLPFPAKCCVDSCAIQARPSPPPSLLALHSLFMCVGFQIYKQGGLVPKPPSWVQTPKCQWCWEAGEQSGAEAFSWHHSDFAPTAGKTVVCNGVRTARSSNPAPSLISWAMQASYLNSEFLCCSLYNVHQLKWLLENKMRLSVTGTSLSGSFCCCF